MRFFLSISIFFILAPVCMAFTQVELVTGDYFPADLEFQELRKVAEEEVFEDPARIAQLEDGSLFAAVGCRKYARRVYETENGGLLSIEIASLADAGSAYSLLSMLAQSGIKEGPPGAAFSSTADTILLAKGSEWIRFSGQSVSTRLMQRVADSVSNRIPPDENSIPSLIAHLPFPGYDPSSLRYFPALEIYEKYSGSGFRNYLQVKSAIEIARAHYTFEDSAGDLLLLNFPTPQAAEEYFEEFPGPAMVENSEHTLYTKRVGPMVAVLEGNFDSVLADRILDPLKFEYSIRWIYDKRNQTKVIWGIPTHILGTVVKSLLFVALLCLVSIAAGAGLAFLRFGLRGHRSGNSPDHQEQTEIIRLRLR